MNRKMLKYWESLSDKQLIERIMANDKEAIEYLFFYRCDCMFAHIVKTIFYFNLKKEEMISDLYIFLSRNNWKKLRDFKFNSSLNTWLTIVAIHFFNLMKKNMTKIDGCNTLIEKNQVAEMSIDEDKILQDLSKFELYKAINKLSNPKHRYVLLSELQGITVEEMMQSMNCTASVIYNLTKRAKKELRTLLTEKNVG